MDQTTSSAAVLPKSGERDRTALEKLVFIFLTFLFLSPAQAVEFVRLGEFHWATKALVDNTRVGGLSGMTFKGDKVFMVSDDRGTEDEPRFYEFDFKKDKKVWKLENGVVHFVTLPKTNKLKEILDQEAIIALPSGNFLISSEGDNNKKPRVPPRIYEVTPGGKWLRDIPLPPKVIPESTGQQKIGIGNNFGFEAVALSADAQDLYFMSERPLIQDADVKDTVNRYRMIHYHSDGPSEKGKFAPTHEWYVESLPPSDKPGIPLVRGWSEMLGLGDLKFLVLERSLKLVGGRQLFYECRLAELDMTNASEVSKLAKLTVAPTLSPPLTPAKIVKIHNLATIPSENMGNCEGMAFGPATDEYKQTLWIVTDNNFSKTDDTVLYFYGVRN
jgi:hypothetical protein